MFLPYGYRGVADCCQMRIAFADSDEDLESVQEAMGDLAGSSATKRKRAKQIVKSPEKIVSLN